MRGRGRTPHPTLSYQLKLRAALSHKGRGHNNNRRGSGAADGGFAARSDIAAPAGSPPLSSIKILPVDYAYIPKESARIKKKFNEVFQ